MSKLKNGLCTWMVQERVKTVNLSCIMKTHKMLEACREVSSNPAFEKARTIFHKAFLSEDESQGGCKDLGGPE